MIPVIILIAIVLLAAGGYVGYKLGYFEGHADGQYNAIKKGVISLTTSEPPRRPNGGYQPKGDLKSEDCLPPQGGTVVRHNVEKPPTEFKNCKGGMAGTGSH